MTIIRTNCMARVSALFVAIALAGCGQGEDKRDAVGTGKAAPATESAPAPEPVNGWVEYPLAKGVIKLQPAQWRTDVIEIPVPANGGDLEYKLGMKNGDAIVYSIDFGNIEHPGMFVSEFHGHTAKRADGVGDLMFYSKTGGSPESGQFTAPWDGIHGWYLKNDSAKDAVVTLKIAGFYELVDQ